MTAVSDGANLPGTFNAQPYGDMNLVSHNSIPITMQSGSILTMSPETVNGLNGFSIGTGILGNDTVTEAVPASAGPVYAIPFLISAPAVVTPVLATAASIPDPHPELALTPGTPYFTLTTPALMGGGLLPYPYATPSPLPASAPGTHPLINSTALANATISDPDLGNAALIALEAPALGGSTSITVEPNDPYGAYLTADGSFSFLAPAGFVGQVYFTYAIGLFQPDGMGGLDPYLNANGHGRFSNAASVVINVVAGPAPSAAAAALAGVGPDLGLPAAPPGVPPIGGPWPTFHHDDARTGAIGVAGITNPALVWHNQAPLMGASGSAVIDAGATTAYVQHTLGVAKLAEPTGAIVSGASGGAIGSSPYHMGTPTIDSVGRVYVSDNVGHVAAYGPDGAPLWNLDAGLLMTTDPLVPQIPAGGTLITPPTDVYVGVKPDVMDVGGGTNYALAGRILAITPVGTIHWSALLDGKVTALSFDFETGMAPGYFLYARTTGVLGKTYLYKLDARTGQTVWRIDTGPLIQQGLGYVTLDPDKGRVYYGVDPGIVVGASMLDGHTIWEANTGSSTPGAMTLWSAMNTLYVSGSAGITAFNTFVPPPPLGAGPVPNPPLWSFQPAAGSVDSSPALATGGMAGPPVLYFSTNLGHLYAISPFGAGTYWDVQMLYAADPAIAPTGDVLITLNSGGAALITQAGPPVPVNIIPDGRFSRIMLGMNTYNASLVGGNGPAGVQGLQVPHLALAPAGVVNGDAEFEGMLAVNPGQQVAHDFDATVPYEDSTVSFEVMSGPNGATIDADTGELTWTPGLTDIGDYTIVVRATEHWSPRDPSLDLSTEMRLDVRVMSATPAQVSIDALNSMADANGHFGVIRVTRYGALNSSLVVPLIVSGTAIPGVDYDALPASVTLEPGQYEVAVGVVVDSPGAIMKNVAVALGTGTGYALTNWSTATVNIVPEAPPFPLTPCPIPGQGPGPINPPGGPDPINPPGGPGPINPPGGPGPNLNSSTTTFTVGTDGNGGVVIRITVTGGGGGVVNLMDGMFMVGTAALDANGVAVITFNNVMLGFHNLTAFYLGDPTHTASSSAGLIPSFDPDSTLVSTPYGLALALGGDVFLTIDSVPGELLVFMWPTI